MMWRMCLVMVAVAFVVSPPATAADPSDAERAAELRKVTKGFAKRLKGELMAAIKAGGPAAAIPVCHTAAPAIADEMTSKPLLSVGRTAIKLRNPSNAPDDWERRVLNIFQNKADQGVDLKSLKHFETSSLDGARVFRYMKAIPVGKPCLTCHGVNVSAELKEKIQEIYPEDKATGFGLGQLRGAFTIVQGLD